MPTTLPRATIRTQVTIPLRLADGYATTARAFTFDGLVDGREHLALGFGSSARRPMRHDAGRPTLVRLHSECLTGDVLGSERCDCGPQLREAVGRLDRAGGYLLYLRQEGRGIGLYAKLDAYQLQSEGLDTYAANVALGYAADERDYAAAAQMLLALGLPAVRLLSNNPDKVGAAEPSRCDRRRGGPDGGPPELGERPVPRHQGRRRSRPRPDRPLSVSRLAGYTRPVEQSQCGSTTFAPSRAGSWVHRSPLRSHCPDPNRVRQRR